MTLSFIHSGMCINDVESSLYRLNKNVGVHLLFLSLSSTARRFYNEILDLRLNICLYYLLLIFNVEDNVLNNTFEKCKTKPMLSECLTIQPFEHLIHKQPYTIDMLFASFMLERFIESTHTYRIGYND
jgi:hypothetical protein